MTTKLTTTVRKYSKKHKKTQLITNPNTNKFALAKKDAKYTKLESWSPLWSFELFSRYWPTYC